MEKQGKKNIIIHVGLPKTGTSFLQLKVFPHINNVYATGNGNSFIHETPFQYLLYINRQENNPVAEKDKIAYYISNLKYNNILLSSENLAGNPQSSYVNYKDNVNALKEIFNEAKIVFTTRRQADFAESIYNQVVIKEHKINPINEFLSNDLDINNLDWLEMYNYYVSRFGKENVLFLPYEMLKEDLNEYLRRFYEFSGLEPFYPEKIEYVNLRADSKNVTYRPWLAAYDGMLDKMKCNWLKKRLLKNDRNVRKFLGGRTVVVDMSKEKLSDHQKELIKDTYRESNIALSEQMGVDLGQYGYY